MRQQSRYLERWRAIPNFPDYEVPDAGNVRSWKKNRNNAPPPTEPRLMKLITHSLGYKVVCLRIRNKQITCRVNRLVLIAWKPKGRGICRHLNGDKLDNRVCNLAWGSYKENTEDSKKHGTFPIGEKVHNAKLSAKDVRAIRSSTLPVKELAVKYQVTNATIRAVFKRKLWSHLT